MPEFYEFFAGGGMVRAGLGEGWTCRFANDLDPKKAAAYRANFGDDVLRVGDVGALDPSDLPGVADLAWASFPCQDLSLAGAGAGLEGARSGAFHLFWRLVRSLGRDGRAPKVIALENVCGAITSNGGRDLAVIGKSLAQAGYRFGFLVVNADLFVPQSRARLFVIGVRADMAVDPGLLTPAPTAPFHSPALCRAVAALPAPTRSAMVWWKLPTPLHRVRTLAEIVEEDSAVAGWGTSAQTSRLLALMSPLHLARLDTAKRSGRRMVGSVYRRTRSDPTGRKVQRAEVRFDDVAGCLRTPAGGSSRQTILVIDGEQVRSRLISARETARLMGLPDNYTLPTNYTDAYHLTGDGVAVDVVRHLAHNLFEPLLAGVPPVSAAA